MKTGAIVVLKSTVPVGTFDQIWEFLGRCDVGVVSNPEFLREGHSVWDFMNPDRIVVGAPDAAMGQSVVDLYCGIDAPVLITDHVSACIIKLAANSLLATRLAFINSMADLCERVGGDIRDVVMGVGLDSRIGGKYLHPGPGFGGSCLPKDARALAHASGSGTQTADLIGAVLKSNEDQFGRIARLVLDLVGTDSPKVAIWGVAFKADTNDVRDSPAVEVMKCLLNAGVTMEIFDPEVRCLDIENAHFESTPSALDAAFGKHAVLVLTEWNEFATVDAFALRNTMTTPLIIDTRLVIDADHCRDAGVTVYQLGIGV